MCRPFSCSFLAAEPRLAGLAGVIGGNFLITEPSMAATLGPIVFVVIVVGGMGSLTGALIASLLLAGIQTFAVGIEYSLSDLFESDSDSFQCRQGR